jgi:diguanylate cyclase (GGDEF)-like protein
MDNKQKNSILIVDDEIPNLVVLSRILGSEYTIYTAKNGEEALEKAREYTPDLILLDIVMPGIDGYEVLNVLKNTQETRRIPVIFITGLSSREDEEKGLSLDAADYISKPFSAKIVRLRVRNQIQIINQLRTIERLSLLDQLTGIANRRSFDEKIRIELKRAARERQPISILIMDIDKFKEFNDNYGHQLGDFVLQTTSAVMQNSIRRSTDFIARWGGEEFVVLLPNTSLEGALEVAEQIRANIEKEVIPCGNGQTISVTVSIGANTLTPNHDNPVSIDIFFSDADKALYKAKELGRNRVQAADADNS